MRFRSSPIIIGAMMTLLGFARSAVAEPPAFPSDLPQHANVSVYQDGSGQPRKITQPDHWQARRNQIRENMEKVMGGLPKRDDLGPVKVEWLESMEQNERWVRRKLRFQSEPDSWVPAYLFLPSRSSQEPVPAVLCLHQTTGIGKGEPAGLGGSSNLHYAKELADLGFVTLAPDYPSFGEYEYDFVAHPEWASGSLKAVWDNMRAIDLLQQMPEVVPSKIGCIGHSLGGHNTIFTAFFDSRIVACASSCGFTRFHKYYEGDLRGWTSPRYMPRIREVYGEDPDRVPFDFPELIAGLAPRAFFTSSPLHDANFDCDGVRETLRSSQFIYDLLQSSDRLQAVYPDSEHDFPPAAREAAYRFLADHLR